MTGALPPSADATARAAGAPTSGDHERALRRLLASVIAGSSAGICVVGGREERAGLLRTLAAALPGRQVRLIWLDPDPKASSPADLARCLAEAEPHRAAGGPNILLVVPDADGLRRDSLDMLDDLAGGLREAPRGLQLLLAGDAALLTRLQVTRKRHLESYLTHRLTLTTSTPAGAAAAFPGGFAHLPLSYLRPGAFQPGPQVAAGDAPRPGEMVLPIPPITPAAPSGRFWATVLVAVLAAVPAGLAPDPVITLPAPTSGPAGVEAVPEPPGPAPSDRLPETAEAVPPPGVPPDVLPDRSEADPPPRLATVPPGRGVPDAGLLIVARSGDSLAGLYRRIYAGLEPPPFEDVVAANPRAIRPGARVMFPRPPGGWQREAGGADQ